MRRRAPRYEDYRKMIQKISWRYARRSCIEFEEIEAQGNLIFCEAAELYVPERGASFSTYLYRSLENGLLRFVLKEQLAAGDESFAIDDVVTSEDGEKEVIHVARTPSPDRSLEFRQVINHMTPLSAAVCAAALSDYASLGLAGDEHPRKARGIVARTLSDRGAPWSVVWSTLKEIRSVLQEA